MKEEEVLEAEKMLEQKHIEQAKKQ